MKSPTGAAPKMAKEQGPGVAKTASQSPGTDTPSPKATRGEVGPGMSHLAAATSELRGQHPLEHHDHGPHHGHGHHRRHTPTKC